MGLFDWLTGKQQPAPTLLADDYRLASHIASALQAAIESEEVGLDSVCHPGCAVVLTMDQRISLRWFNATDKSQMTNVLAYALISEASGMPDFERMLRSVAQRKNATYQAGWWETMGQRLIDDIARELARKMKATLAEGIARRGAA
jgi:hypothetical protein